MAKYMSRRIREPLGHQPVRGPSIGSLSLLRQMELNWRLLVTLTEVYNKFRFIPQPIQEALGRLAVPYHPGIPLLHRRMGTNWPLLVLGFGFRNLFRHRN